MTSHPGKGCAPRSGGHRELLEWIRRAALPAAALGLIAGAVLLGWSAARRPSAPLGQPPDRPRTLGEFELTERSGRTVRRAELEGRICVVSFVFTGCGTACLEVGRNLARLQERLSGLPEDVRLVSVTLDPRSDTPAVLSRFANGLRASPDRWVFLTGAPADVERWVESSFLPRDPQFQRGRGPSAFTGMDRVFVVDRAGQVRGWFDGRNPSVSEGLFQAIQRLRLP